MNKSQKKFLWYVVLWLLVSIVCVSEYILDGTIYLIITLVGITALFCIEVCIQSLWELYVD